jgi:cell division protein FtsL
MAAVGGSAAFERRAGAEDQRGSRLGLVARSLRGRSHAHTARRLGLLAASLVVGIGLLVAASQAVVADHQIRIDNLQQQLATSVAQNENLEVARAELTAPTRILQIAEDKLGMTVPSHVTYLVPISPGSVVPDKVDGR